MRFSVILVVLCSVALVGVGAETSDKVVLGTGTTIEDINASVRDNMVWITYKDGHMAAYSVDDVDLEASGLLPEVEEETGEAGGPVSTRATMANAAAASDGSETAITITDADVEHVKPEEPGEPDGEEAKAQGPLVVSDLFHNIVNGRVNVKGSVTNQTAEPVEGITIVAVAKGFEGAIVANGRTQLTRALGPKKSAPFSLMLVGSTDFESIDARALASPRTRGDAVSPTRPRSSRPDSKEH